MYVLCFLYFFSQCHVTLVTNGIDCSSSSGSGNSTYYISILYYIMPINKVFIVACSLTNIVKLANWSHLKHESLRHIFFPTEYRIHPLIMTFTSLTPSYTQRCCKCIWASMLDYQIPSRIYNLLYASNSTVCLEHFFFHNCSLNYLFCSI